MKAGGHLLLSSAVGAAVWIATDTPAALPVAVATGALVDGDHLLDAYLWYRRRRRDLLVVALHGWEYLPALAVLGFATDWHPLSVAALLGYLSHLMSDQIANPVTVRTYFLIYRVGRRFRHVGVTVDIPLSFQQLLAESIPMYRRATLWLARARRAVASR